MKNLKESVRIFFSSRVSTLYNVCSVHREMFSTLGDTMSTSGDIMSTSGDVQYIGWIL